MKYIGKDMLDRMKLLDLTADEVAEKTFMEKEAIDAIIQDRIALEQMDEFDVSLICNVLHCRLDFFTDEKRKENDILVSSIHKELDSVKSLKIKAGIQDFVNDFAFVTEVLADGSNAETKSKS